MKKTFLKVIAAFVMMTTVLGSFSFICSADAVTDLPASYDSADYGRVTPIKKQSAADCWCYAAVSTIESAAIAQGLCPGSIDLSEGYTMCFTSGNGKNTGRDYALNVSKNNGGNYTYFMAAAAAWNGFENESDFSTDRFDDYYLSAEPGLCSSDLIVSNMAILSGEEKDEIKRWIMRQGAVSMAIGGKENALSGNGRLGHEVSVVGWDNQKNGGAWLVKDSGYGRMDWVSYDSMSINEICGYELDSRSNFLNNYNYTDTVGKKYYFDVPYACANVYTARSDEILSAIGFYVDRNFKYTVEVFTDCSSPCDAGESESATVCVPEYDGYRTIRLDEPVRLSKGRKFTVSVSVEKNDPSAGNLVGIVVERNTSVNNVACYTSDRGESFMKTGTEWKDNKDVTGFNGDRFYNNYIYALTECEHKYSTVSVCADCRHGNQSVSKCEICGNCRVLSDDNQLSDHDWSAWSGGFIMQTRACRTCGEKQSRNPILAALRSIFGNLRFV